jgi:RNA polymerase sigma-70 factor, ECF subfamily
MTDGVDADADAGAALQRAWREERAAVLATVARRLGDLQKAEDAVQEAFAAAAVRWPAQGVPDRPAAWLTTAAWRKALDALRADRFPVPAHAPDPHDPPDAAVTDPEPVLDVVAAEDDVLSLILTCCNPALAPEAQVALTLRHVAGLTDRQIAARFLVPEATLTKRLVRARGKIRDARISFELPDRTRLEERLVEVRAVVYLIFTEGYLASGDEPSVRADLCDEAIWLARQLHRLGPDPETTGLLALLLLQNARAAARRDADGHLVPYDEQDRTLWDADAVEQAKQLLATTGAAPPGPYQLQAAIALLHATAPTPGQVNWTVIAQLYDALARVEPSPVVEVNRALAVGRARGAQHGLAALRPALDDPRLAAYVPLHAAHAELLERAGDPAAAAAWERAAALAGDPEQRAHLTRRAVRAAPGPAGTTG